MAPAGRARRALARYQPQAYHLVDVNEWRGGSWPPGNRVSAWARIQQARTPPELLAWLAEEMECRRGAGEETVRQGLHAWAGEWWERLTGCASGFPPFEEMEQQTGGSRMPTVLEARVEEYRASLRAELVKEILGQGRAEGIEQGIRKGIGQGRADGERAMLCRMAARRFGPVDADRLRPLLRRMPADVLVQVADWLIDCEAGEEVVRRVQALAGNGSPAGR